MIERAHVPMSGRTLRVESRTARAQAYAGIGRGRQIHDHRGNEQAARVGQHHAATSAREVLLRIILPRTR